MNGTKKDETVNKPLASLFWGAIFWMINMQKSQREKEEFLEQNIESLESFVKDMKGQNDPVSTSMVAVILDFIFSMGEEMGRLLEQKGGQGVFVSDLLESQAKVLREIASNIEKSIPKLGPKIKEQANMQ